MVQQGGAYRHQVRGKAAGKFGIALVGRSFNVILTSATSVGQRDEVLLDTGGRSFTYKPGSTNIPVKAEVMARGSDGSARFATLITRGAAGATDTVRYSGDTSSVTYEHHGPASYEFEITALNHRGKLHTFKSGLRIATDGHTATFSPSDWHDLIQVTLTESTGITSQVVSVQPVTSEGHPKRKPVKEQYPREPGHPVPAPKTPLRTTRQSDPKKKPSKQEPPRRVAANKGKGKEANSNKGRKR